MVMSKEFLMLGGSESFVEPPCEEFDILDRTDIFAREANASGFVTETILQFRNGKGYPESAFSITAISYEQLKKGIEIDNNCFTVEGYGFLLSGKKRKYEKEYPLAAVSFIVMEDWKDDAGKYTITPCIVQLQGMTLGRSKKDPSLKPVMNLISSFQWTDALIYIVEEFSRGNNYKGVGVMPASGNLSAGRMRNFTIENACRIYDDTAERREMKPVNGIFYKRL